ncbi:YncE family protein [Legionella quinlivanii]|uniref:YncE family protein n=1 Tax=Legionella quinlivanii TaxID=45073 RepID=UPI0022444EE6|nr:WD40 repeat domain-containing protein [Legionella quinlivanii]MCW8452281.1 WD40 repeat domain-containing protein [Legionella quinlivanii]
MAKDKMTNKTQLENERGYYKSAYSSVSKHLLIARNNDIQVVNSQSLQVIKKLRKQPGYTPADMLFLEDGQSFICWNNSGSIDLWNIESGISEELINGATTDIFPDGGLVGLQGDSLIVKTDKDFYFEGRGIRAEDRYQTELVFIGIKSKNVSEQWLLRHRYNDIRMYDGYLVCGSGSGRCIDVYSIKGKKLIKHIDTGFPVYTAQLVIEKDKKYSLACSGCYAAICIYDFDLEQKKREIVTTNTQIHDFLVTPDGCHIFIPEYDNEVVSLHRFDDGQFLESMSTGSWVTDVHFNENDKMILAVDFDGVRRMDCNLNVPTPPLINMAVNVLEANLGFFANEKLTEHQVEVLKQHFDIEENTDEDLNDSEKPAL